MERIVLEVDSETARKWRTSFYRFRSHLNRLFSKQINELSETGLPDEAEIEQHYDRVQESLPEYRKLLDKAGKEASDNGLTPEKLDEMLSEEE
ncbi:hypothetical protein [Parabacteroides sp. Marseille-P3160]|uniref:hypothetical protein n=1 Tax=Parabacteroides sp. Marseille-P3160 TaxID=1917887 RepID=UPI0009BB950E|nr:hypothetical protein [Parabacteroides sp. Marseille-P3160]